MMKTTCPRLGSVNDKSSTIYHLHTSVCVTHSGERLVLRAPVKGRGALLYEYEVSPRYSYRAGTGFTTLCSMLPKG